MSAYKIQTLGTYSEESIQHSEHGENLKSRWLTFATLPHVSGVMVLVVDCQKSM